MLPAALQRPDSENGSKRRGGMKNMTRNMRLTAAVICLLALLLAGCAARGEAAPTETALTETEEPSMETTQIEQERAPRLLYLGHASLRIVTPEDNVIYIDPFAGEGYDLPADLILVTHGHYDHCALERVTNRRGDCRIITHAEALENGGHQVFELPYVTVQAVEAGYNRNHDVQECVGYVLTFTNGVKLYVSGDTSTTGQMSEMAEMEIDYAFYCCDGVYNMGPEEAARCAELVGARHSIPYHNVPADPGNLFDSQLAEQFDAPNRLILCPGEELELK